MKTLRWLWAVALLVSGFKLYGLLSAGPGGYSPGDMQSFAGMILTLALLTVLIAVIWMFGLARKKVADRISSRNASKFENNLPGNA